MHVESWTTLSDTYRPFWRLWETSEAGNAAAILFGASPIPSVTHLYPFVRKPIYDDISDSDSETEYYSEDDDEDEVDTSLYSYRDSLLRWTSTTAQQNIDPRTVHRLTAKHD